MRFVKVVALMVAMVASPAVASDPKGPATAPAAKSVGAFDTSQLDRSVKPCENFYGFVCNKWKEHNPMPPDRSRYGQMTVVQERNQAFLHELLEAAAKPSPKRSPLEAQVGDFYASCMNEELIAKRGLDPIKPYLDRVAAIKDEKSLIETVAHLHRNGIPGMFSFGPAPDMDNSDLQVASFNQGGLGLADRDFYFREDAKSKETREKYVEHVANMFQLLGKKPEEAAAAAKTIMAIEMKLAEASMDRVAMRNPDNRKNPMTFDEFKAKVPAVDFATYIANSAVPEVTRVNVTSPKFYEALNATIAAVPIEDWKTYFIFRVVSDASGRLPKAFEQEAWNFYQKYLTGAKEMQPRWKKCVGDTDRALGDSLGQLYVEKNFGPEGKKKMAEMIENLRKALEANIKSLQWMGDETKARALMKLAAFNTKKVGHPETWKDYAGVTVDREDFFGNAQEAFQYERKRNYDLIGGKTDKTRWGMTPPTVNAYYSPPLMEIVFPAGILQPPLFDRFGDDAYNYGGIGAVIGHEFSHGFDDQGRKYDHQGNAKDWWTADDAKKFEELASCYVDQYAAYEAGGVNVNGKLTLGENIGDNAGIRIAYMAYKESLKGKEAPVIDGLTGDQRFFLGWTNTWCTQATEEALRNQVQTDPHSPGHIRAVGPLLNMPEFEKAWGCKDEDAMVPESRCRVW
ncbi:MAG TPA: M13 family metallopeptidase [Thermoanaerobaculia bacterium]